MNPTLIFNNHPNSMMTNSKLFPKFFVAFFRVTNFTQVPNGFVSQFGILRHNSFGSVNSVFNKSINHIVRVSTKKKMFNINTSRIIASMTNFNFNVVNVEIKKVVGKYTSYVIRLVVDFHFSVRSFFTFSSTNPVNTTIVTSNTFTVNKVNNFFPVFKGSFVPSFSHISQYTNNWSILSTYGGTAITCTNFKVKVTM